MEGDNFVVALIQNNAGAEVEANVSETLEMSKEAINKGANLICTPEYFSAVQCKGPVLTMPTFEEKDHPALPAFKALALEKNVWIHLGSLPIKSANGKTNNRSYIINANGEEVAHYNKIHTYDVQLYHESDSIDPGDEAVLADLPWGKLGMTICYDFRFPNLYRKLAQAGADFLTVPSAFVASSGPHWHVLLRARAIENGAFVFAAAQVGTHPGGIETYGHSLVVDPMGQVLADGKKEPGVVMCEIDPQKVKDARKAIPSISGDRPYKLIEEN